MPYCWILSFISPCFDRSQYLTPDGNLICYAVKNYQFNLTKMFIEINTPQDEVPEHIIFYLKGKLMDFYHKSNQFDKPKVVLKQQQINETNECVCEVTFNLYGETIMIHRSSKSYLQAIRNVIREISKMIDEFFERRYELPHIIATTVRV